MQTERSTDRETEREKRASRPSILARRGDWRQVTKRFAGVWYSLLVPNPSQTSRWLALLKVA